MRLDLKLKNEMYPALIDSGSAVNIINQNVAEDWVRIVFGAQEEFPWT